MNDKKYVVYKHTSPNGLVYIGITCQRPTHRWNGGNGYSYNHHFYNAIKKYGWDNFEHEILFENLTQKEAKQKEIELIDYYDSTNRNKGYNVSLGGDILSEESIQKMSKTRKNQSISKKYIEYINNNTRKINQYDLDGNFIRTWNSYHEIKSEFGEIERSVIYNCCVRKQYDASRRILSYLGFQWRFIDDCDDISKYERRKQDYSKIMRSVYEIDINGNIIAKYKSLKECSEITNTNVSSVKSVCKGDYATTKEHIFIYADEYNEENIQKHISKVKNRVFAPRKKVCEIDSQGNVINIYNSVRECAKSIGIKCESDISGVCNGRLKTAKGRLFRYYDDVYNA